MTSSSAAPGAAGEHTPYNLDDLLSGLEAVAEDGTLIPTQVPLQAGAPAQPEASAPFHTQTPAESENPQWDPSLLQAEGVVAALHALAEDDNSPQAAETETPAQTPAQPSPAVLGVDPEELAVRIESIIASFLPEDDMQAFKGSADLPEDLRSLAVLLSDPPPANDFTALDALYACWPRATQDSDSRALLAVALNLSRLFGLPGKLPMSSTRAWRMLSPKVYEAELAQRLRDIDTFIAEWQSTQRTFLILDFGEVELIEYLFEALHPGTHAELLAKVMNFKVLSNRRLGLLRRIPNRLKKVVMPMLPAAHQEALVELAHAKLLLEQIGANGFAPIAEASAKAQEEIDKMMKAAAAAAAPQLPPGPPGGGLPLGRIG